MSDDLDKPERPEERLVFHYNRERRLENAPEAVQRAYRDGYTPNRGFIRGLTANAGLRSIFVTIIILCAVIGGITFLGEKPGAMEVGDFSLRLKAFPYDENVFITLQCAKKNADSRTIPVNVSFSAMDSRGVTVDTKESQGVLSGTELTLRTVMTDMDIETVAAKIRLGNRDVALTVAVDRK
jgi:hypothetical protein